MTSRHRGFEFFLRAARPVLTRDHGTDFAAEVIDAARLEYERVLPQVPDIGGMRNVFQPVMTINGWIVALHRAMRDRGKNAEESIRVSHEVVDGWLRGLPSVVLRAIGWLALSAHVRWYFEGQARRSQKRQHAEDFVWRVEQGAEGEFSFVFDECAVNKWYDAQDVRELSPYCNFADVTYSRLMGMGVDATETIGLGCEQCALRFKHGRETIVPRNLGAVIAEG
ncbi:MAG: L-2-amino-thiazoline-4-carboxylic acid hydrolase [Deltaproteobacteria bacterium]|nr:L-2-amino-thiazoline-4-carboxylic acid hydrolase [Deltaproteobacteria bacterium]